MMVYSWFIGIVGSRTSRMRAKNGVGVVRKLIEVSKFRETKAKRNLAITNDSETPSPIPNPTM